MSLLRCCKIQKQLSKRFSLGPLSHEFVAGSVSAVLGHNGAGKSTFFRLASGLDAACKGEMVWGEQRIYRENHNYKRSIGYLPQPLELPLWVSAEDLLTYVAKLKGITNHNSLKTLTIMFGIDEYRYKALASCSYGMRKRVALVVALLGDPQLLILDEPLSGLDVTHINSLRNILKLRRQNQHTTLLSTHILSFACEEASHVLLMNNGKWQELAEWSSWNMERRSKQLNTFFV